MLRVAQCALALMVVLASVTMPACGGICCPQAPEAAVHARMPCCTAESSMATRDASPAQPATFARNATFMAVIVRPATFAASPTPVQPARRIEREKPHEPTPPLFLLNAQFLI
jgi:hypothetical protein